MFLLSIVANSQALQDSTFHNNITAKTAPALRDRHPNKQFLAVRIQVADGNLFKQWARQYIPEATVDTITTESQLLFISNLKPSQLDLLANCKLVTFIDVPNRKATEELKLLNADLSLNTILAVHQKYPMLNGASMAFSLKENPFDMQDIDLKGRIIPFSSSGSFSMHATMMATIAAGGGNSAPESKGVAWNAKIASSNFAELLPDDGARLISDHISVQNHSYGVGIENYYGLEALAYDKHCRTYPTLLHIFSAGNQGTASSQQGAYAGMAGMANLTGQFKMSKNTLSVGAINTFGQLDSRSSKGPAYDGRVKPEIVAYGEGGTSEAAALVSGIGLLVQQAYKEKYGFIPPAALVKAALINSADEVGSPGIDFETGYGQADALGAIQTIQQQQFFIDSAANNQQKQFTIHVPAGMQQLKVTLVWHDKEAAANAAKALVNDLDLVVSNQHGQRWLPWALSHYPHADSLKMPATPKEDHLNTVEQITLHNPDSGTYTLTVSGYHIEDNNQPFSIAYEYSNAHFSWTNPVAGTILKAGQAHTLRWQSTLQAANATLEYRYINNEDWHLLTDQLPLTQGYFLWHAPDSIGHMQLRITANGSTTVSDTFLIAPTLDLQVGFDCGDDLMLFWNNLQGVEKYQLYQLEDTHLAPLLTIADTLLLLDLKQHPAKYFAIAPVVDQVAAARGATIDYKMQGTACYIQSFLPRLVVSDTIVLDLSLSTSYNLASLELEKWEKNGFKATQIISPVEQLQYSFKDSLALQGRQLYRIKLTSKENKTFYSDQELVYRINKNELMLFPNPVARGESFTLLEGDDQPISLMLFDNVGRKLYESTELSAVKSISTAPFLRGSYIVRIQTLGGKTYQKKLLIL